MIDSRSFSCSYMIIIQTWLTKYEEFIFFPRGFDYQSLGLDIIKSNTKLRK